MSSLAASRADGFYFPPDYDPAKHKSLNKFRGSHGALGARANKLDQGILVIRFEVPFHVTCTKCGEMIAKGERFNAEKKCIGEYHYTNIWEFRMRHHCGCILIIVTDPKNAQYNIVEGARQKNESYSAEDAGVIELQDEKERERLRNDPLYRLEHGEKVKKKAKTAAEDLADLQELNEATHRDDYSANKALRAQMRRAKAEDAALDARRDELGLPTSIALLPETDADGIAAQIAFLSDRPLASGRGGAGASGSRQRILDQSIFPSSTSSVPHTASVAAGSGRRGRSSDAVASVSSAEGAGKAAPGSTDRVAPDCASGAASGQLPKGTIIPSHQEGGSRLTKRLLQPGGASLSSASPAASAAVTASVAPSIAARTGGKVTPDPSPSLPSGGASSSQPGAPGAAALAVAAARARGLSSTSSKESSQPMDRGIPSHKAVAKAHHLLAGSQGTYLGGGGGGGGPSASAGLKRPRSSSASAPPAAAAHVGSSSSSLAHRAAQLAKRQKMGGLKF